MLGAKKGGKTATKTAGRGNGMALSLLAILALTILPATLIVAILAHTLGKSTSQTLAGAELEGVQGAHIELQRQRYGNLNLITKVFNTDDVLKQLLGKAAQVGDTGGIEERLRASQNILSFDIGLVTDATGVVFMRADQRSEAEQLGGSPLFAVVSKEKKAQGVWQRGDKLYHAVAFPLAFDFQLAGYIIVGYAIDNTLTNLVKRVSGGEVIYLVQGPTGPTVIASNFDKRTNDELITALRGLGNTFGRVVEGGQTIDRIDLLFREEKWQTKLVPLFDVDDKPVGAVMALTPLADKTGGFEHVRNLAAGLGLLALAVGFGLASLLLKRSQKPAAVLADAVEQAAGGHYELQIPQGSGDLGRIAQATGRLLANVREQHAAQFIVSRVARLLPEPAKSAPRGKAKTEKATILAIEMRRLASPKLGYDPEEALGRFGRDLQRISASVGAQKGALTAVFGHRALCLFEGDNAGVRALTAASEILLTMSERENVFDEPDPPVVALTSGSLITGSLTWGDHPAPVAAGLPMQQLESLMREATPGEIYLTRQLYDELAQLFQSAGAEVRQQRGLLSPQPLLLISREMASKVTGTRALSETRAGFPGEGRALSEIRPGLLLGNRFEIQAELGAGRMGITFKALDRELNDFVTLKILRPEVVQDTASFERLKRAVAKARTIRHPNVLAVLDFGESERIAYISMEFARGMTLAFILAQAKAVPLVGGVRMARQIAWGLAAAHGQQLMHGGLKPENILVESDGNVRVLDFGVSLPPRPGALITNPGFLAPEQLEGRDPDSRADFWGYGAVVFAMLTGRLPFPGGTVDEIRRALAATELPPPSTLVEMPKSLEDILLRCLAKSPDGRYQSAAELVADLDNVKV
jgi:eukaryotic-like serine/threonine-protein kinase